MTDYFIRELLDGKTIEVAKFDQSRADGPLEVYRIYDFPHCSCLSPRLPCKHAEMVRRWREFGSERLQYYYDDKADAFQVHPFLVGVFNWSRSA